MVQLRQDHERFVEKGVVVAVVGPEKSGVFEKYWREESLPFIGIPDPDHTVLNLYGQQFKILKLGRLPAQALVDKKSIIRFVHYGSSMRDIPSNEEILALPLDHEANVTRQ